MSFLRPAKLSPTQGLSSCSPGRVAPPRRQSAFRHLGLSLTWAPRGPPVPPVPAVSELLLSVTFPTAPEGSLLLSTVRLPAYSEPVSPAEQGHFCFLHSSGPGSQKVAGTQQVLSNPLMSALMGMCLLSIKPLNVKGFSKKVTNIFPSLPNSKSWLLSLLKSGGRQQTREYLGWRLERELIPLQREGYHFTYFLITLDPVHQKLKANPATIFTVSTDLPVFCSSYQHYFPSKLPCTFLAMIWTTSVCHRYSWSLRISKRWKAIWT